MIRNGFSGLRSAFAATFRSRRLAGVARHTRAPVPIREDLCIGGGLDGVIGMCSTEAAE